MADSKNNLPSSNSISKVNQKTDRTYDFENDLRGDKKFAEEFSPSDVEHENIESEENLPDHLKRSSNTSLGTRGETLDNSNGTTKNERRS